MAFFKLSILFSTIFSFPIYAITGKEIMVKVDAAARGLKSEKTIVEMELKDAHGRSVTRELQGLFIETDGKDTRSLITFLRPLNIKGTKLLTWTNSGRDNQQWLFLPALRKSKKINNSNKANSFLGSEFTYEDFQGLEIEDYEYTLLNEDSYQGEKVWIIEQTPLKSSGYSKVVSWISKDKLRTLYAEYFDRSKKKLKTYHAKNFEKLVANGKTFFKARELSMSNLLTRKVSIMRWKSREIAIQVARREFDSSKLRR